MKFKIGDRVKFLDEHGGGVISKIVSHNLVHVAIEDGFEIPTLTNNLIKAEEMGERAAGRTQEKPMPEVAVEEEDVSLQSLPKLHGRKEMPHGLYLAFLPQDQQWLMTGKFDIFLVNHTDWDVLFSLFLDRGNGEFSGKDYDIIEAASRLHLATVKPERLEYWSRGTVQFIFRKDKTDRLLLPASIDFRIKGYRFLKEGAYQEYSFMEGKCFLVSLAPLSTVGYAGRKKQEKEQEKEEKIVEAAGKQDKEAELIHEYRTATGEAVVDLHIQALMNDYSRLGKHDILTVQTGHFLACLESGIRSGYSKIIFIHGIGAGKLRSEIERRLRDYPGISFEDAPMKDYGQGAVLVRIFEKARS